MLLCMACQSMLIFGANWLNLELLIQRVAMEVQHGNMAAVLGTFFAGVCTVYYPTKWNEVVSVKLCATVNLVVTKREIPTWT